MKAPIPNLPRKPSSSAELAKPEQLLSPFTGFIMAAALAAIVVAVYRPALDFKFILDDHRFVTDPRLQSSGHLWDYFTNYVWAQVPGGPPSFYRPMFVLWLRLNFILSGASAWGWHLLSILKHVSTAILLGLLVWELLRDRPAALIAGTLFALHPAQTESVAWVTVPDPLMAAAALGTLLLYLTYADRMSAERFHAERFQKKSRRATLNKNRGRSPVFWIAASAAACLAALMSKETALMLPIVLFAMELIVPFAEPNGEELPAENGGVVWIRFVSAFRRTLPFLAVTVLYLLLRLNALKGQFSTLTQHLPWSTVLLSWPAILWFYVKVMLWPVVPRAFADPTLADAFSLRGVLLPGFGVACAAAVLASGCVWAWRKAQRDLPGRAASGVRRALVLGVLLLVLPILLALNLNVLYPGDFLHGRYTYLPLTGLMLLLATGWHVETKIKKWRVLTLVVAGLVAIAFGVLTVQQEGAWQDDLTVFTVAHRYAPNNGPVAQNLANANVQVALGLDDAGRCDEALPIFEQAIQHYPQDWFAWAGRGECLFKLGDLPGAEQSLRRASELSREPRVIEEWQQVRARLGLPLETLK